MFIIIDIRSFCVLFVPLIVMFNHVHVDGQQSGTWNHHHYNVDKRHVQSKLWMNQHENEPTNSFDSNYNRDYFDQINALNHKPIGMEESRPSPTIASLSSSSSSDDSSATIPCDRQSDYRPSYSNELNKLLMQKYYNRDIVSMSALLGKHPPPTSSTISPEAMIKSQSVGMQHSPSDNKEPYIESPPPPSSPTPPQSPPTPQNDDEEDGDYDEEGSDDQSDQNKPTTHIMKIDPSEIDREKLNQMMVDEYKSRSGDGVMRLHGMPRLVRPSYQQRSMPIRLAAAHSHSMPHYYVPHSVIESGHHLGSSSEKSSTWLGSGLAAGILIGAIPFGIMMASMMPTLLTTAMPIVNTATVAGRRRRRRRRDVNNLRNVLFEQTMDTLSIYLRKGFNELIKHLSEENKYGGNHYHHHDDHNSDRYIDRKSGNNNVDLFNTVARYAIASVDEPRCIKEMICTLVVGGRHSKTTSLQKTLYILTKW
ncbi:hypothetical protein RDWZM_008540 [Blomia tropicalis]|uniref:Uncharacterized protein n=1 Tax=Blomia tropicalis TaxID=40697 RepID=A0A9Q0LZK2_BLOTA|nr:hypothetical protein RDWZM_008540 [Blomia tropicalis]